MSRESNRRNFPAEIWILAVSAVFLTISLIDVGWCVLSMTRVKYATEALQRQRAIVAAARVDGYNFRISNGTDRKIVRLVLKHDGWRLELEEVELAESDYIDTSYRFHGRSDCTVAVGFADGESASYSQNLAGADHIVIEDDGIWTR